jgi:uncharacterized membrane protein YqiK
MQNSIAWGIPALIAIAGVWLLVTQNRRINRENAEALAERERQLAEARTEAIRSRSVYKMPFQNLKAKRDAEKMRLEAMPNIDWEEF